MKLGMCRSMEGLASFVCVSKDACIGKHQREKVESYLSSVYQVNWEFQTE
jgi:hypothetical protein